MKLLRSILWAAVLFACTIANEGLAEAGCELVGRGFSYAVIRDGEGDKLVYRLSSTKSRWTLERLDFHASAGFSCGDCRSDALVRGMMWIGAAEASRETPDMAELQHELDTNPKWSLPQIGFKTGKLLGPLRGARLDGLTGWRYAFEAFQENDANTHNVVVVSVDDGCGALWLRLETSPSQNPHMMNTINDLLSALKISKTNLSDDPDPELREHYAERPVEPPQPLPYPWPMTDEQFQEWLRTME
jgi:hypothetical protein